MRSSVLLVAALVLITVTGCGPDAPVVVPGPESSTVPLFASDEEALAAAEDAYAAYLAVVDTIFADGGEEPERLEAVATRAVSEKELPGFQNYVAEAKHQIGTTSFDTMTVQSADLSGYAVTDAVVVYVCEDFSGIDVLNSDGVSILSSGRKTRWPVTVSFDVAENSASSLAVSGVEQWTGDDFCV